MVWPQNAGSRSAALNLSQLVDFNQSGLLPEVNIAHNWGRLSQSEASLLSVKIQDGIAIATTEASEAIASSDFLKIMGISPPEGANRGDSDQFWSLRLVDFNVWLQSWMAALYGGMLGNLPLILDGYVMNDIWTTVQNRLCNLKGSPCRARY